MRWLCVLILTTGSVCSQTVVDASLGGIKEKDFESMKEGLRFVLDNATAIQFSNLYYSTRNNICGNIKANVDAGLYPGFQLFAFDPLLQRYYFSKSMSSDLAVPPEEKASIERAVGDLCKPAQKQ